MRTWPLVLVAGAGAFAALHRRVLAIERRPCWPPPPDAVTPAGAQAAVAAASADPLQFAWSTAATLEPWAEGESFFPRIFADVEAATSSVHILMFGWREGELGMKMAAILERKLAEGVAVRAIVDNMGSKPRGAARAMYTGLADAGAEIQVHDFRDNLGRVDHRKLYVIDGKVAWTGGAGIEDHFNDGRFHDVMVRVTGDVVRQAQAAFLDSFRGHGGALPTDLARCFPEPDDPGSVPVVLTQVLPGGFVAASHAIGEQIEQARERLDVMNPYFTDRDMVERILAAAGRGVKVRVVVSEVSNNHSATAALKYRYGDLFAAGVEVWELPGTVVHAKVIVADDVVSFGTVNLDAWALYRNSEIMLTARSAELAALMEERLFEPDIARCTRGEPPSEPRDRLKSWLADKLTYYL